MNYTVGLPVLSGNVGGPVTSVETVTVLPNEALAVGSGVFTNTNVGNGVGGVTSASVGGVGGGEGGKQSVSQTSGQAL